MKENLIKLYSHNEQVLLQKLDKLFDKWRRRWDENQYGWFIRDGFYPGYLSMKKKILFFARDCYNIYHIDGTNPSYGCYISEYIPQYTSGILKGKSINVVRFHKLLVKISYALLNGGNAPLPWQDVPSAKEICNTGKIFHDISFAFMNLGKLSHEGSSNADWELIKEAVSFSIEGENLIKKEIELLSPDLIISMNLNDNPHGINYLHKTFGKDIAPARNKINDCNVYKVSLSHQKSVPLLDCWHFAGRFSEEYIWKPINDALSAIHFY